MTVKIIEDSQKDINKYSWYDPEYKYTIDDSMLYKNNNDRFCTDYWILDK